MIVRTPKPTPVPDAWVPALLLLSVLSAACAAFFYYRLWSLQRGSRARELDLESAWPSFKKHAPTIFRARLEFLRYIATQPAWRRQRAKWTKDTLDEFVRKKLV